MQALWDIDFEGILDGFWEGFGRPKSLIFVFFSVFLRCRFSSALRKAKKSSNMSQQDTESENFGPGSDDPLAPGERQREGYKIFALHKELGFSDLPSVIGQDVSDSEFETSSARRWHTFGGRRIETPRGGEHRRPTIFGGFVIEILFWQAFLAFLALLAFCL